MTADVGLVYPGAGKVKARGELAGGFLELGGAAGLQALLWRAFEDYIFYSAFFADLSFGFGASVGVDHKDVGPDDVECGQEVEHSVALVDVGLFDVLDAADHKEPFLFGIDGLVVFVVEYGVVRAYADIEVAILSRLSEELNVTAVQQVVTSGYEYFLVLHCIIGLAL